MAPKRKAAAADAEPAELARYVAGPQTFADHVGAIVRAIPRGETLSYSRVAAFAGRPGGARAVVRALHALKDVPWWRVVRADGTVAEEIAPEQIRRLGREGVRFSGRRIVRAKPRRSPKPKG